MSRIASPFAARLSAALLAAALLSPGALAGGVTLPVGFNVETQPGPGVIAAVLADGRVLLHTGVFLADDLLLRRPDGSVTLFATGIGSLAGLALSPVTGDIVAGDSVFAPPLHVLRDLNADGDALDAGENVAHPATLPVLSNGQAPLPFDLAFRPGTDELYVSGSTPFGTFPVLGVVARVAGGAAAVWAEGLGFAAGMVWSGDVLHAADADSSTFVGRVLTLHDGNADGDALDAGESAVFADGLQGASDLVRAQDGSFYLSGVTGPPPDFAGAVARLLPDGDGDGTTDGVEPTYFGGFSFTGNLTLAEGGAGLLPGAGGDGTLAVQDFNFGVDRLVRSAPAATLTLTGTVKNNAAFDLAVGGESGAGAVVVLSLDQSGVTLHGVGDLAVGFAAPYLLLPLPPLGVPGGGSLHVVLHGVDTAVGLAFTVQGFTLQGGKIGIGNAIDAEVAP